MGRLSGRPFSCGTPGTPAFPHGDLIGLAVWRALELTP